MSNREFTATRTMLANVMATAGAELLEYMGTAGALAAIPNTDPPQYVVAGTLQIIGKLLPGVEPTSPAVPAPSQVPAELSEERIDSIAKPFAGMGGVEGYRSFARAVERELRAGSRCAQPKLDQLHNAIMNLPAMAPYDRVRHSAEHRAYLIGHRNARHAAAELVNGLELRASSSAVREQAQAELVADLSEFTDRSIREHADFRDDIERLSTADSRTRKALRKEIYDTIDARVRNAVKAALSSRAGSSDVRDQALEEAAQIALKERDEFRELAAKNNSRESDYAFGSVNSAERICNAIRALKSAAPAASKEGYTE